MAETGIRQQAATPKPSPAQQREAEPDFERIVREYQPYVTRLAWRLLGWREDIEDVVQDVFVTVLEKLETFRGQSSLQTWLTAITINRCRRHQRKQRLRLKWFRQAQANATGGDEDTPETALVNREQNDRLRQGLQRLPRDMREVLVLRYLQQQSIQKISEILKLSVNTVNVRLHRARKRLSESIK